MYLFEILRNFNMKTIIFYGIIRFDIFFNNRALSINFSLSK